MAQSPDLDRRQFVTIVTAVLGSIMGAVVGLPAIGYLISPALAQRSKEAWIPLGVLDNYSIGTPTIINFTRSKVNGWEKTVNSYGVYVYRKSQTEVLVFSNICTHLSCRVTWNDEVQEYACPCHDAHFDIDGGIVFGPPPRPLDGYETKIEDGYLFILFQEA